MILGIAAIIVVVLVVLALVPVRRREPELKQSLFPPPTPVQSLHETNLRQQQLREEATAIADEYQRRADEVWLEEVKGKATGLLGNQKRSTPKS